ncbi:MAG: J domain-containing protein [Clostridia bacterium]|nr:J domain-containing protein [Clostridia bacterium]
MIFKNYYKLLGLTKNIKSTPEEIKSAYREQAKKYHPDINVNNKAAEECFKDINEGYRILSDPIQKRKYDKSWYNYVGKKLQKEKMSEKEVRVNDIVNMFFGSSVSKKEDNTKNQPIKGENIETKIDISIKEAFEGTQKKISFTSADKKNKIVTVEIPKGIGQGKILRIEGKGKKGKNGGKNGDLLLKINIVDNAIFKLVGNDIYANVYLTPWDAALGAKVSVDGIDGEVSILIPKGTQSGDKISIQNKGYYSDEQQRGKFVLETKVVVPKKLSEKEKELFLQLRNVSEFNPNNIVNIK